MNASFWAGRAGIEVAVRDHWDIPAIMADIDSRVPEGGMYNWLWKLRQGKQCQRALSLGSGHCHKEIALIENGLAEHVTACDLSPSRCEKAEAAVAEKGLQKRITVVCANASYFLDNPEPAYDLVHWDNSLHHMPDVAKAIKASWAMLMNGGCFYFNEYVGANHMQWSDKELAAANRIRKMMPRHWFAAGTEKASWCNSRQLLRRPLTSIAGDEAPNSFGTRKMLADTVPTMPYILLGGIGYFVAMSGLCAKVKLPEDKKYLKLMLAEDRRFSDLGLHCYACGLVKKEEGIEV